MAEPGETQSVDDETFESPATGDSSSDSGGRSGDLPPEGGPDPDRVSRWGVNDQVTEQDTLGYEEYVATLQSFLTHDRTTPPLTVSVEGEWGSGKSSFMQQLKGDLDDDGHVTVWFNPWRHEEDETLWASFMIEFFNQVSDELTTRERLRGHVRFAWLRFEWREARWKAIQFLPVVAAYLALVAAAALSRAVLVPLDVLAGIGVGVVALQAWIFRDLPVQKAIQNYAGVGGLRRWLTGPDYGSRVAFVEHFHSDFDKVLDAYVGDRGDVFVFIDDLDRCVLPKAPDLLRSINMLIGNDPDVFFVVGIDREPVAAAITAKHEDILQYLEEDGTGGTERTASTKTRFGVRYIRKFVQVPFRLPKPSEADIRNFTESVVRPDAQQSTGGGPEPSAADGPEEIEDAAVLMEVVEMVSPALDDNPRMIKTFINLFRLRGRIASRLNLLDEGVTVYQLGKFVAIGLRWPELVAALERDPDLLAELQRHAPESRDDVESLPEGSRGLRDWLWRDPLREVLRAGERDGDGELAPEYSLEGVPVEDLLQISPQVGDPTSSTRPGADEKSGAEAPREA